MRTSHSTRMLRLPSIFVILFSQNIACSSYPPIDPVACEYSLWARRSFGNGDTFSHSVAALYDCTFLAVGSFGGEATFGRGEFNETTLVAPTDGWHHFMARYYSDGSLAWASTGVPAREIAATDDGSFFITGAFEQELTLGYGEANETTLYADGNAAFLARYNPDDTLEWARKIAVAASDIDAISGGTCFLTGMFDGSVTFGPDENSETRLTSRENSFSTFLVRYDADGSLAWARKMGGTNLMVDTGVSALPDGTSFIAGCFTDTATFGMGEAGQTTFQSLGCYDLFVARFDFGGNLVWVRSAGGEACDCGGRIQAVPDGSSLVTGGFYSEGPATFGLGEKNETVLVSRGNRDVFLARYDPSGRLVWAASAGSVGYDCGNSASYLPDGSAVVIGQMEAKASFGGGHDAGTNIDVEGTSAFVARYESDGTPQCIRRIGGPTLLARNHIIGLPDGTSVAIGGFGPGKAKFELDDDKSTTFDNMYGEDMFLIRTAP